MELKAPTPKRKGRNISKSASFSGLYESSPFHDNLCEYESFTGLFNGNSVIVDDPDEMKALYTMGFFGKASLSKGFPNFNKHKNDKPLLLKEYQWERRKTWSEKLRNLISNFGMTKEENRKIETAEQSSLSENETDPKIDSSSLNAMEMDDECIAEVSTKEINLSICESSDLNSSSNNRSRNILVVNDCSDDDTKLLNLNPRIETEPFNVVMEVLYLTLEEAFFLSFGLGCLQLVDLTGKPLSLAETWRTFSYTQPDFIENYVTYHYFRAKGWVVKSGIKFGGQFLLYKDSPSSFHASYIVIVDSIKAVGDNFSATKNTFTWDKMISFNRMAETCNKEILICKVQWPELSDNEIDDPLVLKRFKVKEFLIRRWQPSQE